MHHLGEVVQCAACAVRTYSVYEPETLFFINMTEERLQSCMCQVRGMMVTVLAQLLGMVTVCIGGNTGTRYPLPVTGNR